MTALSLQKGSYAVRYSALRGTCACMVHMCVQVIAFVRGVLDPLYRAGLVSKEQYKAIAATVGQGERPWALNGSRSIDDWKTRWAWALQLALRYKQCLRLSSSTCTSSYYSACMHACICMRRLCNALALAPATHTARPQTLCMAAAPRLQAAGGGGQALICTRAVVLCCVVLAGHRPRAVRARGR